MATAWPGNLAPISLGDRVCLSQGAYLCAGNHNFRSPGFDLRLGPIRRWWWGRGRGGPTTTGQPTETPDLAAGYEALARANSRPQERISWDTLKHA